MQDRFLMMQAKFDSIDAFNHIVERHQARLYRFAHGLLGNSLAEDCVQETFLNAWEKRKTYRGGSVRAWLMTIVKNKCVDQMRRREIVPLDELQIAKEQFHTFDRNTTHRNADEDPETAMENNAVRSALQECFTTLSTDHRLVIQLWLESFKYREIAEILQIPINTVRSRLARGMAKLRNCLSNRHKELFSSEIRQSSKIAP